MNWSRLMILGVKTIGSSAFLLAVSYGVSRLLGILRDRLLVANLPAEQADVYFAAFRLPDFIYALFVLGGVSVVFLPLFAQEMQRGAKEAWKFTSSLLHVMVILLGMCAAALFFLMPWLVEVITPGFSGVQHEQLMLLSRILLISPILFGVSSIFSGVLQYSNKFFFYALAPIFYNLGIIFGILFLFPIWGLEGIGAGVIIGVVLHILIQAPEAIKCGFSWMPVFKPDSFVWKALRLALPRTLGTAAYQVNLVAMTALASLVSTGSITVFSLADSIQQVPASLVGVSIALAMFPVFSKFAAKKDTEHFAHLFHSSVRRVILFAIPFAAAIFFFRDFIIQVLYEGGEFHAGRTELTGAVLGMFAFGIVFQSLIPLLIRAFFALQDTKTPTFIGVASVVVNISLALVFLEMFKISNGIPGFHLGATGPGQEIVALPLALVCSSGIQAVLLYLFMKRRLHVWQKRDR